MLEAIKTWDQTKRPKKIPYAIPMSDKKCIPVILSYFTRQNVQPMKLLILLSAMANFASHTLLAASIRWCTIGKPATGKSGFGTSNERGRNRVPARKKIYISLLWFNSFWFISGDALRCMPHNFTDWRKWNMGSGNGLAPSCNKHFPNLGWQRPMMMMPYIIKPLV